MPPGPMLMLESRLQAVFFPFQADALEVESHCGRYEDRLKPGLQRSSFGSKQTRPVCAGSTRLQCNPKSKIENPYLTFPTKVVKDVLTRKKHNETGTLETCHHVPFRPLSDTSNFGN